MTALLSAKDGRKKVACVSNLFLACDHLLPVHLSEIGLTSKTSLRETHAEAWSGGFQTKQKTNDFREFARMMKQSEFTSIGGEIVGELGFATAAVVALKTCCTYTRGHLKNSV